MSILDGVITAGLILVCWLLTAFIRDDIAAPHIPQRETNVPDSGTPDDDDLDFTWSLGVGDHRG